jgi:NADH:ubiquinone oxidoreductase subunit F (NADH-binding)
MRTLADMTAPAGHAAASDAPAGLPRLLAATGGATPGPGTPGGAAAGATPLERHRLRYPAPPRPGRPREDFIAAVERSGLRGRGGASFPTGTKLRAVREGRGTPVVVVNGSEGEPASGKDKLLLTMAPHLVLDGALLAAAAVGAGEVVVCVDGAATAALDAVGRALAERGRSDGLPVRLAAIPSRYVAGEETALVHWLNGGPATPTSTPPRPFQRGVDRRPTLIDNVETLAHLAQVLRFGPDWFRQLGTIEEPGSALVTLSGAVERPGVYEIPIGASLAELVGRAGGVPDGVGAVLVGGYFGSWIGAGQAAGALLCNSDLRRYGAGLGCGAVLVLGERDCGLACTARILAWLAGQTAGQCGPCVHGLAAVASTAAALHDGVDGRGDLERLRRWAGQIEGRGACRLPDGAVRLLNSGLEVFAGDLWRHLDGGGCPAAHPLQGWSSWR